MAVPRNERGTDIDAFALKEPWRRFVMDAQQAKGRFEQAVRRARGGPLRNRLREIGTRMETGVEECWRVAQQGEAMSDARKEVDADEIQRELAQLVQTSGQPWSAESATQQTIDSLHAQLASAERMDRIIQDTHDRLRLLDARLDEAVARAIEISVQATDIADLGGLGDDVDSLVQDMEALRQGLEEAGGAQQAATGA
jgi:hypothetical protein